MKLSPELNYSQVLEGKEMSKGADILVLFVIEQIGEIQ